VSWIVTLRSLGTTQGEKGTLLLRMTSSPCRPSVIGVRDNAEDLGFRSLMGVDSEKEVNGRVSSNASHLAHRTKILK
jgi:hypothetical protein